MIGGQWGKKIKLAPRAAASAVGGLARKFDVFHDGLAAVVLAGGSVVFISFGRTHAA